LEGVAAVQVKISVRHGHLSDGHQQQLREKAEKLLHFFNRLTMIEVTVDLQDLTRKVVEILAKSEHKHDFIAREGHPELIGAMELAYDKVVQQIHRHKEKIQDHRRDRRDRQEGEVPEEPASDAGP
jgi:putative sigma-54 modulation protein